MRQFLTDISCGFILGVIITLATILICSCDNTYKMLGYIENGYVIDEAGETWKYDNPYRNGIEVEITFNTNCTDSRYDDTIYKITPKK